jgi:ribosomal protein S18 acetylase RimI-like enzyme
MSASWVRAATPDDAPAVVAAMRDGFADDVLELTMYGCPGVGDYVARTIALGPLSPTAYLVAGVGPDILGAAHLSRMDHDLELSYLSVREGARHQGLGRRLLARGLHEAPVDGWMHLDVFEDNHRAAEWYSSLGFSVIGRRSWWSSPPPGPDPRGEPGATVGGLPQADACHRAFGFSEFSVRVHGRTWTVGRLGDRSFRLTDPGGLAVPGLLAVLGRLDPARRILCLAEDGAPPNDDSTLLISAHRMAAPLGQLRAATWSGPRGT